MQSFKTKCGKCKGTIEFPTHLVGQGLNCPHCGDFLLLKQPLRYRLCKWVLEAVIVIAIGVVVVLVIAVFLAGLALTPLVVLVSLLVGTLFVLPWMLIKRLLRTPRRLAASGKGPGVDS